MDFAKVMQKTLIALFGLVPALLLCLIFVPGAISGLRDFLGQGGLWGVPTFFIGATLTWGTVSLLRILLGSSVDAVRHGLAAGVVAILVLGGMMFVVRSPQGFALLIFALGPLLVFVVLLSQSVIQRGRHYAMATLRRAGLALAIAAGAIAAAPNAAVWWYGRDFDRNVVDAAARVSADGEYCIFDDDRGILVSDFDELDRDRILRRAFYSSLAHSRVDASRWRKHHFRLVVDEKTYYWSFGEAAFEYEGRAGFQLRDRLSEICGHYLSDPDVYRSAYAARHAGLAVSRENFCCPSVGAAEITL